MTLEKSDTIVVLDKNYLHQLATLLEKTPSKTIANYFGFQVVLFGIKLLNVDLHKRYDQYAMLASGQLKPDSKLVECVKRTDNKYGQWN